MILRRVFLALAMAASAITPALAAADKPLVIVSGQTKQLPSTDTLQVSASATGGASINIPHGTAPTSPVNGDCWTTTAGLYCRINGSTVGPYSTGTAGALVASNNLSDVASASTSRTNLGLAIGTNVEAWDADLDALAALTGTDTIYRRSAANTWSAVTIGTGLSFSGGTLSATGGGGSGTVTVSGTPASGNLAKFTSASDITNGNLAGDVTTSGTLTTTIASSAVTLAKIANASANSKLLGAGASGSGSPYAEITLGTNLSMSGTTLNASGGSTTIVQPQGRLTLVTGTPVMTSDQTAKSPIYYDCSIGSGVPYYTGSADAMDAIASCEVSLTMQTSGTGVTNSAGVFDIFWVHSGANRICVATNGSGGGWASDTGGSNTARGTGYSQIHNTRGYWTNVNSITHCYNGTTDYGSISADQGTYLGTVYTTAAGQTGMAFRPTSAAGGGASILGVFNAYNRVIANAVVQDSTGSWNLGSSTWVPLDNGATGSGLNNRVTYIDGLGDAVADSYMSCITSQTSSAYSTIGVNRNSTSATPSFQAQGSLGNSALQQTLSIRTSFLPLLGLSYIQAMNSNAGNAGTASFAGGTAEQLNVTVIM